jgi:phosphotransferase family enzyme
MSAGPARLMRSFRRLRSEGFASGGASFFVQGLSFTEVTVLRKGAGGVLSKAGHLSWRANLEGRPVKISEYPSEEAARLCEAVCLDAALAPHLPRIIVRFGRYIVAEWVEGKTVSSSAVVHDDATLAEIAAIQVRIHGFHVAPALRETSPSYKAMLWSRFRKYAGIVPFERFCDSIRAKLDAAEATLPPAASHPDLTPANLIRDARTGDLVVVDNELMGSHRFSYADLLNTYHALRRDENTNLADRYLSAYRNAGGEYAPLAIEAEAYEALWALRVVGSDLQRGAFAEALATADAFLARRQRPHPLIGRVCHS